MPFYLYERYKTEKIEIEAIVSQKMKSTKNSTDSNSNKQVINDIKIFNQSKESNFLEYYVLSRKQKELGDSVKILSNSIKEMKNSLDSIKSGNKSKEK